MHKDTRAYNNKQAASDKAICNLLATEISEQLPEAENNPSHGSCPYHSRQLKNMGTAIHMA